MPVFDGRQYTHFYHLVTKFAEMGIAFFQFGFFFGCAVQFLIVYAVFGNFSFHCHHDVVEAVVVYICTGRPAERFATHSCSYHFDGDVCRTLEGRTSTEGDDVGTAFGYLSLDFDPLFFSQGRGADDIK